MSDLILHETALAQWQALVEEAKTYAAIDLPHEVEGYLVLLLTRLTANTEISNMIVATQYLAAAALPAGQKAENLREIADKCLILAGLFPQRAEHRHVKISYFVKFGQSAYEILSHLQHASLGQLFGDLSHHFINIMDVLLNFRQHPPQALTPIQALELWVDTQSHFAFKRLIQQTNNLDSTLIIDYGNNVAH